jgi:hypothetical protein
MPTVLAIALFLGTPAGGTSIPPAFQGKFSQYPEQCGRPGESTLHVRSDGLSFWEAFARVDAILMRRPHEVRARLTYTADNESWTVSETLRLSRDRRRLDLVEDDGRILSWFRCQAGAETPQAKK